MGVKEVIEQFHRDNGDDAITVNGWVYFSNGANRDRDPYGILHHPPKDPHERARNRLIYYEELLQRARNEFIDLKQNLMNIARSNMNGQFANQPPDTQTIRELNILKIKVQNAQKKVDDARKEVEAAVPPRVREQQAQMEANKGANIAFAAMVQNINI